MQLKILPKIKSPADIRDLSDSELLQLSDEVRSFTIETITEIGGHLAPTLGVIELTVALHKVFDTPKDKIIWDVGHQGYAHKILTGRLDKFNTIRRMGGLSGFLKRSESEYDVFGAGHASTSISAAVGVAEAQKHNGDNFRVVSVIGDGSMTGGLAFEAMNNAGHLKSPMIVILNDNEMSISPNVGALNTYLTKIVTNPIYNQIRTEIWEIAGKITFGRKSIQKALRKVEESLKSFLVPGMLFEELGFRYFGPIDGHDLPELVSTLDRIKDLKSPALLHVLTKKGKGMVSTNVDDEYYLDAVKFHAVKPNKKAEVKIETSQAVKNAPVFQDVFGAIVCEVARNRKDTVCITAAMREGTGLVPYAKEFSDRYYDVGIAEGHGVTFAAGLATQNVRPIVAIYSTFLQRAYDHIIHDAAIQHLPVVFCMDRAGIAGEDGPTHHGALDIAYLKCIQDMVVTAPKDGNELRNLLYSGLDYSQGPFSIRYPKASSINFDQAGQAELLSIGNWEVCRKSTGKTVILSVGPQVFDGLTAADNLSNQNIECEVVNCRFIKPMDYAYLQSIIGRFENVVTVEEGVKTGGFGEGVAAWLVTNGFKGNISIISLPDEFVEHGPRDMLLEKWGVNQKGIENSILSLNESVKLQY
ncbi:MAG: 1-deoxy-D-xylulose-5-phosphate synthase [Candidatus Marinimicrobia bacterium]|nr:1-deoxy-D-xylulose-5-phosphate synthase [Candidatus Neomarinimicrobiota bacterium]|tara:strand:+ start:1212 stop:3134 length:1923 start_codon:yes stop_codon:yes gene_type:complete